MPRRQLTEQEKEHVIEMQREPDGSLRCYISGEIINLDADEYEFDHVHPVALDGENSLPNMRAVLKKYHVKKGTLSLYEVRENLRLEKLFNQKKNSIKLQDIIALKGVERRSVHFEIDGQVATISDGEKRLSFHLIDDPILGVKYFYGRVPVYWVQNDDQEGLQPRVIDYKRLITLRDHLHAHPQMAPAIARLLSGSIRLFDGQHKVAAQLLNDCNEIDIKVYISPDDPVLAKLLFDSLMMTNLEAHSKMRQVPFYTSTLIERFSVIYKELWEDFATQKPTNQHSEANFYAFLVNEKGFPRGKANDIFRAEIKETALHQSELAKYIAEASKDASFPLTQEIMNKIIFPSCLYLQPSPAICDSPEDYRNQEAANFVSLSELLVEQSYLASWVQRSGSTSLSPASLKARRIWHKGSVLTWGPYLRDSIINAFNIMTEDERNRLLYRPEMGADTKERIQTHLHRLFNHPLWDEPEGNLDSILVSAQKQDALFKQKGLTSLYILTGTV